MKSIYMIYVYTFIYILYIFVYVYVYVRSVYIYMVSLLLCIIYPKFSRGRAEEEIEAESSWETAIGEHPGTTYV